MVVARSARFFTGPSDDLDWVQGGVLECTVEGFSWRYYQVDAGQVGVARWGYVGQDAKDCYVSGGLFVGLFNVSVEEDDFLCQDVLYCERFVQFAVCDA